ncbi:hypothetical protein [Microbacterium oleivorans]|uniref:hypothetical protein n=1 Tax=Microbacterium oleivorans TaxID=273677 RepID=UPI00080DE06C|nr:hypothetical protein [Microbacterium oleivorans]
MDHLELGAARDAAVAAASALSERARTADAAIDDALEHGVTAHDIAAALGLTYEVAQRVVAGELSFSEYLYAGLAAGVVPPAADERVRRALEFAKRSRMQ